MTTAAADGIECFMPDLMQEIRDRFSCVEEDPISGRRIFLENAGGSLRLKEVVDSMALFTALPDNAGRPNAAAEKLEAVMRQGREDVALLVGARSGTVVQGESTTALLFRVLEAIVRAVPGGNVVTTNLDHAAVYDSTRTLAERYGRAFRVARLNPATGWVDVPELLKYVDSATVVLALSHSSNLLGSINDVATIIREARRINPDLYVVIDGAQHAQHRLVDIEALGCDGYMLTSHKFFSKVGACSAWISDRTWRLPHDQLLGKPASAWDLGTRETANYFGWSIVTKYLCWLGARFTELRDPRALIAAAMAAIERHERALTDRVLHGGGSVCGLLAMDGVTIYGDTCDLTRRVPILLLNITGIEAAEAVRQLERRRIRTTERKRDAFSGHTLEAIGISGAIRVSFCHYNTFDEADAFLSAVDELKNGL